MATFIHGIAASENIDSSGERISILGMDISSLDKDGVFNWEHKADQPGQVVGKILKAKKIFSDADCEDEHELYFWHKCKVPYLYVMGELMDDYKESAKEVAGHFRYEADRKDVHEYSTVNFSIEGAKIEKQGMDIGKSIARKVTITVMACNKAAVAEMVSVAPQKPKKASIDDIFKTEEVQAEIFKGENVIALRKDQPKMTVAAPKPPMAQTTSGKAIHATARVSSYTDFSAQDHKDASVAHKLAAGKFGEAGDHKTASMHNNKYLLHHSASLTLSKPGRMPAKAPGIAKSMTAGSANAAPGQLEGMAALAKEDKIAAPKAPKVRAPSADHSRMNTGFGKIVSKPGAAAPSSFGKIIRKSQWLERAEQEYNKWHKREEFESFMSKRMPHLTKGEIRAIGQVMALNKSMTLEKALSNLSGYDSFSPMQKAGEDSIFTLILFEGCELHDILHCSHFATDAMTPDTYEKIKAVCDEYFEKGVEAKELEFNEAGELGKHKQKVLFLTDGNPYKDLFDKLDAVAPYKYSKFRPHISVTSNVDDFKGKAASLVISVNGEVKKKYDFK